VIRESKPAQAARHVAEGKRIVEQQRALVAKAKEAGRDTDYAESLLDQFGRTQAIFEDALRAAQDKENSN
jgi:hypothetical protein